MTVWDDTLDGLEWCLDEQRRLIAEGAFDLLVPFRPGPDLGPMPAVLADRAAALLAESNRLQGELESQLRALGKARGVVDQFAADHVEGRRPAYVDQAL